MGRRNFPDFIESYLNYVSIHEAHEKVHLWSCISILAAVMERRIWLQRGHFQLFPNLYIFIVGRSGIVRKSTSTGFAIDLLKALPDIRMLSDRVTAGSLIDQIAAGKKNFSIGTDQLIEQTPFYLYASELIVLMREVFGPIIELLTTFWDAPNTWKYVTKHHGSNSLKNVSCNMLACTTLEWLQESVSDRNMKGGFAGRVIFVCVRERAKLVAWPELIPKTEMWKEKFIQDLIRIYELSGEMKVDPKAKAFYQNWYENFTNSVIDQNPDPRKDGYYGRATDQVLKIAMVRSISLSDKMILHQEHIEWAIEKFFALEEDISMIYPEESDSAGWKKVISNREGKWSQNKIFQVIAEFKKTYKMNVPYLHLEEKLNAKSRKKEFEGFLQMLVNKKMLSSKYSKQQESLTFDIVSQD